MDCMGKVAGDGGNENSDLKGELLGGKAPWVPFTEVGISMQDFYILDVFIVTVFNK